MPDTLLSTKLHVPAPQPQLVRRAALVARLNQGVEAGRRLTLISAPAGFGKTTLVSSWLHGRSPPDHTAWLSLDDGDGDLARFLAYVVGALHRIAGIAPPIGAAALDMLQAPQPRPFEIILTALINDIAARSEQVVFVLDDYHVVDSPPVDAALAFLLDHLPPRLHLVIATREDPLLPLARLRARGQLTELRAADLRFTSAETAVFLNQTMGLGLAPADVRALEARTEGWIAGLQLAALSMQGQPDRRGFIHAFTGSHRFVLDYLIAEVLAQQSAAVQTFLLQTAVLNRLTGPLCDALSGQENGQATLEAMEQANLFLVPLDDQRQWYRYHHLFADLLRRELGRKRPESIPGLHSRASAWYEQAGLWAEAMHHAFAAEAFERAADLAERAWDAMNMRYQAVTWLGWVKALPDDLVRARPALSAGCGWASLDTGDLAAAEHHFQVAERWLAAAAGSTTADEEAIRALAISVANGRAYLAQALGDVAGTVKYAREASNLLREDEFFEQGLSDILAGFAYWASGDLAAACEAVTTAIARMQRAGKLLFIISFTAYLADVMTAQGRLREAVQAYLQVLDTAAGQGQADAPETAVAHLGLSELYLEQGDREAAARHLRTGSAMGEQPWFAPWYRHWVVAQARLLAVEGDLAGVLDLLNGAERLYYRHPIPDVRPLKALIARVRLAQGHLSAARHWAAEQGLSVDDDLSYLREFEHVTLARLLIARYRQEQDARDIQDALHLLARLLQAAEAGKRTGSVIEILALQALAYAARGSLPPALISLERALILAEPEGYCQLFVGEGTPMARLLYEALSEGIAPGYVRRLLAAFPASEPEKEAAPQPEDAELSWIEPLSDRETEVLDLIAAGLTNQEIANRLSVALNTVKAHTRHIYSKLGVNSRIQAVARARELGILSPA
ncbi:MAG: AAA family ATPase [Anaerolineales bacterium]|nr:AAA family ATPase [Anaerolineales bacterium]